MDEINLQFKNALREFLEQKCPSVSAEERTRAMEYLEQFYKCDYDNLPNIEGISHEVGMLLDMCVHNIEQFKFSTFLDFSSNSNTSEPLKDVFRSFMECGFIMEGANYDGDITTLSGWVKQETACSIVSNFPAGAHAVINGHYHIFEGSINSYDDKSVGVIVNEGSIIEKIIDIPCKNLLSMLLGNKNKYLCENILNTHFHIKFVYSADTQFLKDLLALCELSDLEDPAIEYNDIHEHMTMVFKTWKGLNFPESQEDMHIGLMAVLSGPVCHANAEAIENNCSCASSVIS